MKNNPNLVAPPAISVILSNYNHRQYIEQALAGLLRQTSTDYEIILTDDGSTDGSQAIIKAQAAINPRIIATFFPENKGITAATAHNLSLARGRYIYATAADDFVIEAGFFEEAILQLDRCPAAAGFFGVAGIYAAETKRVMSSMGSAPQPGWLPPELAFRAFLQNSLFIPGNSSIWRRSAMDGIGGFDYQMGPQFDFCLNHCLAAKHGVIFYPKAVSCQRVYENASNFGMKGTLWEITARLALVEKALRDYGRPFPEMEADWRQWRAFWTIDALGKTGVKAKLL